MTAFQDARGGHTAEVRDALVLGPAGLEIPVQCRTYCAECKIKPDKEETPTPKPEKESVPNPDNVSQGEKKPLPKSPPMVKDEETRAAELLMSAEKAASEGYIPLARVRCRLILQEYPDTKAAAAAAKMLAERLSD